MSKFTVLIDTREKKPWDFTENNYIEKAVSYKLDTGDYSIDGYEKILCIERKKDIPEFAKNINESRIWDFFTRMSKFKYKYLILEFSEEDVKRFPEGSSLPKYRTKELFLKAKTDPTIKPWAHIRVRGPQIFGIIRKLRTEFGINVIFANSKEEAERIALDIMIEVYNAESAN